MQDSDPRSLTLAELHLQIQVVHMTGKSLWPVSCFHLSSGMTGCLGAEQTTVISKQAENQVISKVAEYKDKKEMHMKE